MEQQKFMEIFKPINEKAIIGHHAGDLYWIITKVLPLKPRKIVEIGINKGGSLKFWSEISSEMVVGIDINPDVLKSIEYYHEELKLNVGVKTKIIIGDSTDISTFEKVKAITGNDVDFLYIDGAHDYEHVSKDFEYYSKLVHSGGIVGFHDLDGSDVYKFFMTLRGQKIICDYRHVIGIYYMNSELDNLSYEKTCYIE